MRSISSALLISLLVSACSKKADPVEQIDAGSLAVIGNHPAQYDQQGTLLPWTSWSDALNREMKWYESCPQTGNYPAYVSATFLDANCLVTRTDTIPAMQNGMGILSYVKYYRYLGRTDAQVLAAAQSMATYLMTDAVTPNSGMYPTFPRSTGVAATFPQPDNCGSEGDTAYEIEPDKGGIVGDAFLELAAETHDAATTDAAVHIATVLAATMTAGDATHSPWPFRADYRSGTADGNVSGDLSFILRLFDGLIAQGHTELVTPRATLWAWIRDVQLPNLATDGLLWVQFFEDHSEIDNRTAWAPLNLARYLLEGQTTLDPNWRADVDALMKFVDNRFISTLFAFTVCGEQDQDLFPWGGILSTYAAVSAMYDAATGLDKYRENARAMLNVLIYAIDDNGCSNAQPFLSGCGGWQQDAHFDKIHNFVDAITAFPDWAN